MKKIVRPKPRKQKYPSAQKRMLYRQLLVGGSLVLLLGLLLTATWHITRLERFQITNIEVVGGQTISHETIEEKVAEQLKGTYYRLIPHTFVYLYPRSRILSSIESLPRLHTVSVESVEQQTIRITYSEYEPFALWCDGSGDDGCLFLDDKGYAFAQAPDLSGGALVRYYLTGQELKNKSNPFHGQVFSATENFIKELKDKFGLYVTAVYIHDDIDISYQLAGGAELKISNQLSTTENITNLETIFRNSEFKHLASGDFNYIDLRFGDKVFVNEEGVTDEADTEIAAPDDGAAGE